MQNSHFSDLQNNSSLICQVKIDQNKSFTKTSHDPISITDFECKAPRLKNVPAFMVNIKGCVFPQYI